MIFCFRYTESLLFTLTNYLSILYKSTSCKYIKKLDLMYSKKKHFFLYLLHTYSIGVSLSIKRKLEMDIHKSVIHKSIHMDENYVSFIYCYEGIAQFQNHISFPRRVSDPISVFATA